MPEAEKSLNQNQLMNKNPILDLKGNCFGLCSNFTLYCMKHWNENTADILNGWNNKLERNIYAEHPSHPSDRFAERTHQYQFMQDASIEFRKEINTAHGTSFVELLFKSGNEDPESQGSKMIGLIFPLRRYHIIEIIKREDGYLIYDPNDDKLRFAGTPEKADEIINSRARIKNRSLKDFRITQMDKYLRSKGVIGEDNTPRQKDGKFPAQLAPAEMIALHNAISKNYNDEEFRALLAPITPEQLNSAYSDGFGIIRYAIRKDNPQAIEALLEKGVDVGFNDIDYTLDNKSYRYLDALLKARPNLASLTDNANRNLANYAARSKYPETLEILLKQDPPLDQSIWTSKDSAERTPIDYLVKTKNENAEILDKLLEIHPNVPDFIEAKKRVEDVNKVWNAAKNSDNKKLESLLNQDPPLDLFILTSERNDKTIAHILIEKHNTKGLEKVLIAAPDLAKKVAFDIANNRWNFENQKILLRTNPELANLQDGYGNTVASKIAANAIVMSDYETIEMLILTTQVEETIWTTKNDDQKTLIDHLVENGKTEILQRLSEKYPDAPNFIETIKQAITTSEVWDAIKNSDNEKLESLLTRNPPLEPSIWTSRNSARKTIANILIEKGNTKGLEKALSTSHDLARKVAFDIANNQWNFENQKILLRTNPELVNLKDEQGATVAYKIASNAIVRSDYETIEMLILTTPVEETIWTTKDDNQKTLIDHLVENGKTEILEKLSEKYHDVPTVIDAIKQTVTIDNIWNAVNNSNNEQLESLLRQTPALNSSAFMTRRNNRTIPHILIEKGNMEGLEKVLRAAPDLAKEVAHDIADNWQNIEAQKILLRTNPNLANLEDHDGNTVAYKIASKAISISD
ncbi:MAG: hypothetical protein KA998_02645, partial [Rickettsiaceae bacterium]|nr:hypothetical protein [Rickettsiaceae bacterium]